MFRKSPIDGAMVAHVYARRTLEAGFTAVRDVGAGELIDVAMRNAINRGEMAGPRMQVATLAVSATGGHGDMSGFSPYLDDQGAQQHRRRRGRDPKAGSDRGQVRRRRDQGRGDRRRAVRGRVGRRSPVLARGAQRAGRGGAHVGEARGRPRARHRGHQARDQGGCDLGRARLVHRRRRDPAGQGEGHLAGDGHLQRRLHPRGVRQEGLSAEDHRERAAGRPHAAGELQEGRAGGREDGLWHGRRRVPARLERQAVRQDGRMGHDARSRPSRPRPSTRPSCLDGATGSGRSKPASSPT